MSFYLKYLKYKKKYLNLKNTSLEYNAKYGFIGSKEIPKYDQYKIIIKDCNEKKILNYDVCGNDTPWNTIYQDIYEKWGLKNFYLECEEQELSGLLGESISFEEYIEKTSNYMKYEENGKGKLELYTDTKLREVVEADEAGAAEVQEKAVDDRFKLHIIRYYARASDNRLHANPKFTKIDKLDLDTIEITRHANEQMDVRTNGISPRAELMNPEVIKFKVNAEHKNLGDWDLNQVIYTPNYRYIFDASGSRLITIIPNESIFK